MKEKKSHKNLVIGILSILLLCSCAYIAVDNIYPKLKVKEKKSIIKDNDTTQEVNKRTISIKEEELLTKEIEEFTSFFADKYSLDDISTIDNKDKLYFAVRMANKIGSKEFMQGDIKRYVDAYFGVNNNVKYENIMCRLDNKVLYEYNEGESTYTYVDDHGHGNDAFFDNDVYIISSEVIDNTIYNIKANIIYKEVVGDVMIESNKRYATFEDSKNGKNAIYDKEDRFDMEEYVKVKDKLPVVDIKFVKDKAGNYEIKSIKIN